MKTKPPVVKKYFRSFEHQRGKRASKPRAPLNNAERAVLAYFVKSALIPVRSSTALVEIHSALQEECAKFGLPRAPSPEELAAALREHGYSLTRPYGEHPYLRVRQAAVATNAMRKPVEDKPCSAMRSTNQDIATFLQDTLIHVHGARVRLGDLHEIAGFWFSSRKFAVPKKIDLRRAGQALGYDLRAPSNYWTFIDVDIREGARLVKPGEGAAPAANPAPPQDE